MIYHLVTSREEKVAMITGEEAVVIGAVHLTLVSLQPTLREVGLVANGAHVVLLAQMELVMELQILLFHELLTANPAFAIVRCFGG